MSFTINSFKADSNDDIVSVDWEYSNADGNISNTHILATPAGDFSLSEVTMITLIGWLQAQLGNTAAEFDAYLAERKATQDYQDSLTCYSRTSINKYAADSQASAY
tara:strand:- start:445 stop:762 length:318 start_codon:yes stop_codon:yes gene_type:complete